jgi:hypothetical protein
MRKRFTIKEVVVAKQSKKTAAAIDILVVSHERYTFHLLGTSPFVCNAMSAKTRQGLLLPAKKKNKHEKETTLKHEPLEEYRRSAYRAREADAPTRIVFPSAGFKRSMATAALEMPGTNRSQIGRLVWAEGDYVSLFGIPQLWMTTVRSADMNRTPDVRTRAIIPNWTAEVTLAFVTPQLNGQAVTNLLASAGVFIGVGDGRPEKGALSFGRFEIVKPTDPRYVAIVKAGGLKAQDKAFAKPTYYDVETEELMEWWQTEVRRRGFAVA